MMPAKTKSFLARTAGEIVSARKIVWFRIGAQRRSAGRSRCSLKASGLRDGKEERGGKGGRRSNRSTQ